MNSVDITSSKLKLGIRARLILGIGVIILIFAIGIGVAFIKVTTSKKFANEVIHNYLPIYDAFLDINGQISISISGLHGWIITKNPSLKQETQNAWVLINEFRNYINNNSDKLTPIALKSWQKIESLILQLQAIETKILNGNDQEHQLIVEKELIPIRNQILEIMYGTRDEKGLRHHGLFDDQSKRLSKGADTIVQDMTDIQMIESIALILATIISVFVATYTTRSILFQINRYREHSTKVASGDLTQQIDINMNDEMGQLGRDLNSMTQSLASVTKKISEACIDLVTTSEEVKRAIEVQTSGATEQAASINEITASLEEIEKSSSQTIEKSKSLGETAQKTREKGQTGLEAVEQSVEGMKSVREKVQIIAQTILDLSNKTQQVGEITAVVNTLAQQSKMLALNASIEAAKAGEAGKGFAVVASEVKILAEQSEQSTTQVQKILEDIRHATEKAVMATEEGTKGVDHGTGLVEQTGDIIRNLTDVIHEATIATQQIEAAVRQESVGIEQITAGMNEINQVTASFVSSVKQTTIAINDITTIAKNLKNYIEIYKI